VKAAREDRSAGAGERFLGRRAQQSGIGERKAMINREYELPVSRQCELLDLARWVGLGDYL